METRDVPKNAQIYLSFLTEAVLFLLNPLRIGFLLTFLPEVFPHISPQTFFVAGEMEIDEDISDGYGFPYNLWMNWNSERICTFHLQLLLEICLQTGDLKNKYFIKVRRINILQNFFYLSFPHQNLTKRQIRFYLQLLSKHGFPKKFHR